MKNNNSWVIYIISFVLLVSTILILFVSNHPRIVTKFCDYNQNDFYLQMQRGEDLNVIRRANNSLLNIYDFNNFPSINCKLDDVWKASNYNNNSHELYAHSLNILWDLLVAHQRTQDNSYLVKGKQIILSWIAKNKISNPLASRYSWSEHSTSTRTISILLFFDYYNKFYEIDESLKEEIDKYCSDALYYLSNSINYTHKNNHGIFQDIALLFLSDHLSDKSLTHRYKKLSIKRFEEQILSTISPKGVHLENSAGYNFVISNQIQTFISFLGSDKDLNKEVLKRLNLLEKNKSLFIFPDHEIVPIGDTHRNKYDYDISSSSSICINDTLAGYEIINNDNEDYLLIRSNGVFQNHKHQDEFSFVYYSHGNKIITEPGFLNFSNSLERQFTISFQAHNSILPTKFLDNFNLNIKCLFKSYATDDNYYYSELVGEIEHSQVKREFFMSSNYLIIIDSISTSAEQDWLRIFNLSDDVDEVSIISENTIKVIMKDDEIFYFTSYMNPLEKINGQHSPRIGWLAIPQIKLDPSNAIIQKNTKSKTKFILGISRNNPLEYEYENDVLYIQDPSTTDAVQFNIDNVVINETPLEKNHLESSFNIQKTNSLLYSTWLRIRDYRVQLLYLNVIALCMILIFIMIINGIKLYKNRFLVYAITVLFSYICMIIIFVTFIK